MKSIIYYLLAFVAVYLSYFCLVYLRKKQMRKYRSGTEVKLLEGLTNVNISKIKSKVLVQIMALTNAFIITLTLWIVSPIKSMILKLLAGFVVVILLIIVGYKIVGYFLKKKYGIRKKES